MARRAPVLNLSKAKIEETMEKVKSNTFSPWFPAKGDIDALVHTTVRASATAPVGPNEPAKAMTFRDSQNTLRTLYVCQAGQGVNCFWCLRSVPPGTGQGLPVGPDERCDGTFCGHNRLACAFAWILRELDRPLKVRDVAYSNSVCLLHTLHRKLYGQEGPPLSPAADYRLLRQNGGELDDAAYDALSSVQFFHRRGITTSVTRAAGTIQAGVSPIAYISAPALLPAQEIMHRAIVEKMV